MKKIHLFLIAILAVILLFPAMGVAQSCTPMGNPTVYGTGYSWIGYMYQGKNFNTYKGYINEGNSSANFDESFTAAQTNFPTNGCSVYTDTFSVRFRLNKNFSAGNYSITVGGDDGYRLSLDGGATWVINSWSDHSYATSTYTAYLSGSYNMVLEYYESFGSNRISYTNVAVCTGDGDPTQYGTSNTWLGYMYQGMNFDLYKGYVTKGTTSSPNFDENFGGGSTPVTVATSNCSIQTASFSARYRLSTWLAAGTYVITIGGDDGYRFSVDGGSTWVINKWVDQSYSTTSYTATLAGNYNFVLEYYQNTGYSRISFNMSNSSLLPVKLTSFSANALTNTKSQITWNTASTTGFKNFVLQRSTDGNSFSNVQTIAVAQANSSMAESYSTTDEHAAENIIYYRLAMVDLDGTITYSTVLRLQSTVSNNIRIYPALVENNMVYVDMPKAVDHATAMVFDMRGRKIKEQALENAQGRQAVALSGAVKTGSYIIAVSSAGNLLAKQMIITK